MGAYEDWQTRAGPPWMQRDNATKMETACGAEKDEQLDRTRQAVLANLPGQGPADALTSIGWERMLPRVSGETDDAYATRLRTVWESVEGHSYAGSHGSLLRALVRAGFPQGTASGANIIQRTKRYSYLSGYTPGGAAGTVTFATHNGWTFDFRGPAYWNEFGIIFGADVPSLLSEVGATKLNEVVRLWKPAKARYMGAWVITTSPVWGWPIGTTWGQATLDWGESGSFFVSP
jgi:hypothetical protein